MARPKHEHPTPAELEILNILWEQGPLTVRQVMDRLSDDPPRAYTSVMSLLNVMADKGLLGRRAEGRAFRYQPLAEREQTLGEMVSDLLGRAFGGSANLLVARLLEEARPTGAELDEIGKTIREYQRIVGRK